MSLSLLLVEISEGMGLTALGNGGGPRVRNPQELVSGWFVLSLKKPEACVKMGIKSEL